MVDRSGVAMWVTGLIVKSDLYQWFHNESAVASSSSSSAFDSVSPTPRPDVFTNYRRIKEQAASDYLELRSLSSEATSTREFSFCGKDTENYVPCYNVSGNSLVGLKDGEEFDRHCEVSQEQLHCLVRPPKEYKIPLKWPAGKDVIWSGNVKISKDQFLSSGSMTKRLMLLEENQISFHSEDGLIYDGVKDYSHQIAEMIGLGSDAEFYQAGVRTVLDIGCGFGSFGAHLLSLRLMVVCIAAYEVTGSQVQLALERGLPAIIGNFISRQLPYPSLSFSMVHCAQCGIFWEKKDGMLLIEVDRVLKPGGYFVLTSPATEPHGNSLRTKRKSMLKPIEELTEKLCWSLLAQQDDTFIWQKTVDAYCYISGKKSNRPLCKEGQDAQSYYQTLVPCISGTTSKRWTPVQNRSSGFLLSPAELEVHGKYYSNRPGDEDPLPPYNMIRNVMDMNAHYGGLNAAFLEGKQSVWVMNVVPLGGWVIVGDKLGPIEKARSLATQIRWEARVIDLQNGSDQRLLVCQKPFLRK
ncbi:hypothetical protein RHGRI_033816 [Rhododendron griersonianum]|uniref:Methyltransferase n=1 Tax=Rhododendron griersonianum TaxID=479676 RepID=A0AAV6I187_9ERIC|nr:hypothetical protein RHGRI_033816 [Rhododendron griersonianum]